MRVAEHVAEAKGRIALVGPSEGHTEALECAGFEVVCARDVDALDHAAKQPLAAIVAYWSALGSNPEGACDRIRMLVKRTPLVLLGEGNADLRDAVLAMRTHADDFIINQDEPLPLSLNRAIERHALRCKLRSLSQRAIHTPTFEGLVGESPPMRRLRRQLARMEGTHVTVLLQGESGTGKEVVASTLHEHGPRRGGPFVSVNCAALPPHLLESEFFGHVKGAFTGAREAHRGLLVAAHGGTLLLDEVAAMPTELQPKLLRALQERRVRPVGGTQEIPIDVRLIAASNVDLDLCVQRGEFRSDLYYRLAVIEIALPPLRERGEDVLSLAQHFLDRAASSTGTNVVGFTPAAAQALLRYHWPGNVRELQNAVEAAVAVARFDHIRDTDLPQRLQQALAPTDELLPLDQVEQAHISRVMKLVGGNKAEAARLLGITRKTLYRKLQLHKVDAQNDARGDEDTVNPNG